MEIPHSASLLDGLELCTSHVRSISTKPLTRAAELCDAVPKGACFVKKLRICFSRGRFNEVKIANFAEFCKLLVYKKCPIKSPETATKIGQNCLKLHEIAKVKKIAKIATRNLTQFHPISFNFTQFHSIF